MVQTQNKIAFCDSLTAFQSPRGVGVVQTRVKEMRDKGLSEFQSPRGVGVVQTDSQRFPNLPLMKFQSPRGVGVVQTSKSMKRKDGNNYVSVSITSRCRGGSDPRKIVGGIMRLKSFNHLAV